MTGAAGVPAASPSRRLLLLVSAHNALSRRVLIALAHRGHAVTVSAVASAAEMEAAVGDHDPQLIVCPFLAMLIPESVWSAHRCLIVHPGPWDDCGPSSRDWSMELGMGDSGVTVIEASSEADAGTVWASRPGPGGPEARRGLDHAGMRRRATEAIVEAVDRIVGHRGPATRTATADRDAVRRAA